MQVHVDDPAELRIARSAADHHSALDVSIPYAEKTGLKR
jgi:hypothetical protein